MTDVVDRVFPPAAPGTIFELDPAQFHELCEHDQAALVVWLRRRGFELCDVRSVIRYPLGRVHEILLFDRAPDGRPRVEWRNRWEGRQLVTRRVVVDCPDDPAPID